MLIYNNIYGQPTLFPSLVGEGRVPHIKGTATLSDGTVFGFSFGASGSATVFNTSMTGYQEVMTPYKGV